MNIMTDHMTCEQLMETIKNITDQLTLSQKFVDVDFFVGEDERPTVVWASNWGLTFPPNQEDVAAEVQREWRKAIGLDPITGEPRRKQ